MAFGAVFTSSAGGDIGGGRSFTRLKGQLLVGQPAEALIGGTQTGSALIGAGPVGANGTAVYPLYSFYNRPDSGLYGSNVTSSASEIRWSHAGADMLSFSTVGFGLTSTAATAGGYWSTAANMPAIFIPQTTGSLSSAATPVVLSTVGAVMVWDSFNLKLWVYSSANGWYGIGKSTGGSTGTLQFWTSSS